MNQFDRENQRIGEHLQRAASELPEGYLISVTVDKGAGWVILQTPDFEGLGFPWADDGLSSEISGAIDAAIKHSQNNS